MRITLPSQIIYYSHYASHLRTVRNTGLSVGPVDTQNVCVTRARIVHFGVRTTKDDPTSVARTHRLGMSALTISMSRLPFEACYPRTILHR